MNCKIIATCAINRSRVSKGNVPIKDVLNAIIKYELEIDKGIECDTVIVNNNVNNKEYNLILSNINGINTKNGKLIVENRENYGRSFGAYNYAYEKYKDKYEYWYFTEDKFINTQDGYYKEFIDIFNENETTSFVAGLGIGRADKNPSAHGGVGLTNSRFLNELYNFKYQYRDIKNIDINIEEGSLPYFKDKSPNAQKTHFNHAYHGEVPFTYGYTLMGYTIKSVNNNYGPAKSNRLVSKFNEL